MAEEHDPKISQHYVRLEPLEPPRGLDNTILMAARVMPRGSYVPAGRRRWYYSLAAAAVLVFALALTLHLEREPPATTEEGAHLRLERELRSEITPAPAAPAKQSESKPAAAARPKVQAPPEAPPESRAADAMLAPRENPEQWLERIAELRSRRKDAEADNELAEFRRLFPDYRLTDAMRERVERK
jgi:hypothetical protein